VNIRYRVANTLLVLSLLTMSHAQAGNDLGKQMEALHVHTALLIRSQEMDGLPAWSPDGKFLAVDLAGKWVKVHIFGLQLQEAKWHGQRIGVQTKADLQPMTDAEVHAWVKAKESLKRDRDVVTTETGLKVERRHYELSSALIVSNGQHKSVIWESDLENCYGLTHPRTRRTLLTCMN
jgi:Tol biopolymer transport system component